MHSRNNDRAHSTMRSDAADVAAGAAIHDDRGFVESGFFEFRNECVAHQVAEAHRLHVQAALVQRLEQLEIVADVVTVVVREQNQNRVRFPGDDVIGICRSAG